MNINATLFVQAGNFFIAYLLFRYLFLKPAYQELQQDEAHKHALEDTVAHDKRSVEKERQVQRDAWQKFAHWCGEYRPLEKAPTAFFKAASRSIEVPQLSSEKEKAVKKKMVEAIMVVGRERYGR